MYYLRENITKIKKIMGVTEPNHQTIQKECMGSGNFILWKFDNVVDFIYFCKNFYMYENLQRNTIR